MRARARSAPPDRSPGRAAIVAALVAAGAPLGCVTEVRPVRPQPLPAAAREPGAPAAATTSGAEGGAAPALPIRPVSSSATASSRTVVAFARPVTIPYDGLTLPLFSPDGRYAATRTGPAPDWDAVLATPRTAGSRTPAPVGRIRVFDVAGGTAVEIAGPATLDAGLLLGRSADANGFLIEQPRPDGTRRVGLVPWPVGEPRWIIDDDAVNAHAALAPDGSIAWSARAPGSATFDLRLRDGAGAVRTLPASEATSWLVPVPTGSSSAWTFGLERAELTLAHASVPADQPTLRVSCRIPLARGADAAAAYQAVAALPSSPWSTPSLMVLDPGRATLVEFDPTTCARTARFPGAFAGVVAGPVSASRRLVTGPGGLYITAVGKTPLDAVVSRQEPGELLSDQPLVPRSRIDEGDAWLLVGPVRGPGQPPAIRVIRMSLP